MTQPGPPPLLPPGSIPRRPATAAQATALASAARLRILRMTFHHPMTNKEIAQRLGRDPATTLHHVRKLVDAELLEALPVRRGTRGSREIPYRATGLSWALDYDDDAVDAVTANQAMLEAFLGEVADAGVGNLDQWRLALRLADEDVEEFRQRLRDLLIEFAGRPVAPGNPLLGVYVAINPTPEPEARN